MHLVFYILLLELTENPKNSDDEVMDDEYKVERILKKKLNNGRIFYLIS